VNYSYPDTYLLINGSANNYPNDTNVILVSNYNFNFSDDVNESISINLTNTSDTLGSNIISWVYLGI